MSLEMKTKHIFTLLTAIENIFFFVMVGYLLNFIFNFEQDLDDALSGAAIFSWWVIPSSIYFAGFIILTIYGIVKAFRSKERTLALVIPIFALFIPLTPILTGLASIAFYIRGLFLLELMNKSQIFLHLGFLTIFLFTLASLVFLILVKREEQKELLETKKLGFSSVEEREKVESYSISDKEKWVAKVLSMLKPEEEKVIQINEKINNLVKKTSQSQTLEALKSARMEFRNFLKELIEITSNLDQIERLEPNSAKSIFETIKKTEEDIGKQITELKDRIVYLENFDKVRTAITTLNPGVQISLKRLLEQTGLPSSIFKTYLSLILKNTPEVGELIEDQEIFIRYDVEVPITTEEFSRKVVEKPEKILCIYCNAQLQEVEDEGPIVCLNCGKKAPYCEICKNIIVDGEKIVLTKPCNHIFHKNHILEWIKVKGTCPICKEQINEESLRPFIPE